MSSRYECKLPVDLLQKAVTELKEPEDNDMRLAAIDKLRTEFQEKAGDLELVRSDDAFLLRFLRARKFDQDRALETIMNYHNQRKDWPELFELVDKPEKLEDMLSAGVVLPCGRAKNGTFVIYARPGLGFTASDSIIKFIAIIVLTMEKLLENEEMQIHGITVIEDMNHFGPTLAAQLASYAKKFIGLVQDAMPLRVKSLNMINEGIVFDIVFSVAKHFMKDKMKKRIHVIGSDYKQLHEKIDPINLPFVLGGTGSDVNPDVWKRELLSTLGQGEDTAL